MELFIFQTNIKSKKKVNLLGSIFKQQNGIINWSIDLEDVDKVLRIEATAPLTEAVIVNLVENQGIFIKELPD